MITDDQLEEIELQACPGCGSCAGMFNANSMNCLCEAIGMALPGNGTVPAVHAARIQLAKRAGERIVDLVKQDIKPLDILVKSAFHNALAVDMALGCSTNSVLHLLAVAQEAGIEIELSDINTISERTPNLCRLSPAGPSHIQDLNRAGGVPAVMAELKKKDLLDLSLLTVTGKTVKRISRTQRISTAA
jgi:dihydroxy-acid dehydratase